MSKKISELQELLSTTVTNDDILPILDISENVANTNKKIKVSSLLSLATSANTNSPAFTGIPTTPTASINTNTTQIASTAFVQTELNNIALNDLIDVNNADSSTIHNKVLAFNTQTNIFEPQFPTSTKTKVLTTATTTITNEEDIYLFLDPNNEDRSFVLPLGEKGLRFVLVNLDFASFYITIQTQGADYFEPEEFLVGAPPITTVDLTSEALEFVFCDPYWYVIPHSLSTGNSNALPSLFKGELITSNGSAITVHEAPAFDNLILVSDSSTNTGLLWKNITIDDIGLTNNNYSFNGYRITNVHIPLFGTDAVNKTYVDNLAFNGATLAFVALTDVNVGTPSSSEDNKLIGWDNSTSKFIFKEKAGTSVGDLVKLVDVSGNSALPSLDGSLLYNINASVSLPLTDRGDILTRNDAVIDVLPVTDWLLNEGSNLVTNRGSVNGVGLKWQRKFTTVELLYTREIKSPHNSTLPIINTHYDIFGFIGHGENPALAYVNPVTNGQIIVTTTSTSGLNDPTNLTDQLETTNFQLNSNEVVQWEFVNYTILPYVVLTLNTTATIQTTSYIVEVSNDNVTWIEVDTFQLNQASANPWRLSSADANDFYKYLRFRRTSSSTGNNTFSAVKLYGYVKTNPSQGDVFVYEPTRNKIVPVKPTLNGQVLTADFSLPSGVKWAFPPGFVE